jgi:hypothetical protein
MGHIKSSFWCKLMERYKTQHRNTKPIDHVFIHKEHLTLTYHTTRSLDATWYHLRFVCWSWQHSIFSLLFIMMMSSMKTCILTQYYSLRHMYTIVSILSWPFFGLHLEHHLGQRLIFFMLYHNLLRKQWILHLIAWSKPWSTMAHEVTITGVRAISWILIL